MKGLLIGSLILITGAIYIAWSPKDCDHVFTMVAHQEIKVSQGGWVSGPDFILYGKHQGQELICVKCFHKINQVIDYGPAPEWIRVMDSIQKANDQSYIKSGRIITNQADTLVK